MRILSIFLKNIKSHRDRELHFVDGINVLSGDNGVGKSTVFEAIGYALFGVDARDFVGNIDRFITIGEKKGEISVIFETSEVEQFKISRTVGAGSKWLLAKKQGDSFEIEDHSGAPETESRIKELLGLDSGRSLADQFKLVIGPFQNEFLGPFVLKQPRKRQEAFDEILGIDAWRKTYKSTSTLQATVKSKIEVLGVEIDSREKQVAVLPEKEKELKGYRAAAQSLQKELAEKEQNLAEIHTHLTSIEEQEKKVTAIKTETKVLESRLSDGKEKIIAQKNQVKEAEHALKTMEKSRKGKEAFEAAETNLKTLRDKEKKRREIDKEKSSLDKELNKHSQTLEHESGEVEKTENLINHEEKRLLDEQKKLSTRDEQTEQQAARLPELRKEADTIRTALGLIEGRRSALEEGKNKLAEGVCPFFKEQCQNIAGKTPRDVFSTKVNELDKEHLALSKRLQGLNDELAEAEKAKQKIESAQVKEREVTKQLQALAKKREDNAYRRKKLEKIRVMRAQAEKKVAAHNQELKKYSGLDGEIAKIESIRTQHQGERDTFFAHQKDAQELKNRLESLQRMQQLFDELKASLTAKLDELAGLEKKYNSKQHEEIRLTKEKLVADIATLKQKIGGVDKDRKRIEGEIKKLNHLQTEIKEKQVQKRKLHNTEKLVKFLRNKIFNNVSLQLSERFREEISIRADRIYRTIAETDEELFWGENYQILLRDMQNGEIRERSDDQLSGGQIMSAVVALRLALLQTIGARIAFFDEPTSNLDAARRENLAHAFRAIDIGREEVTDHWYDQLFLISHDVAFTEVTDQIISLEM